MINSEKRPRAVSIAIPLVLFILTILPAFGLLIAALTIWLSHLFDSAIISCIVAGGSFLLIAQIVYFAMLRRAVKRVQERLETIYETSRVFQSGFDWINEKIGKFWS
ncbi:MAG: hypothetical protein II307_03030 [Alistipes sp.]|nr:hypothetical protein [Alistipes sp.]